MIIAIILLGTGLLGLAGFSYTMTRQIRYASLQQTAALVVQSRLDSLASITCTALAPMGSQSGSAVTLGVTERWIVTDGNDVKTIVDTVRFTGRVNSLVYKSIIPCRD
jgi:hypothetical protein